MKTTLRFDTAGLVGCLYTEAIDLRSLGKLAITRATDIQFNETSQQWEVHDTETNAVLFSNPSRSECLAWENENLQPSSKTSLK